MSIGSELAAGVAALKAKLASLEPAVAAEISGEVGAVEAAADKLATAGLDTVEGLIAAKAPAISADVAMLLTAAKPALLADLNEGIAYLDGLVNRLQAAAVAKVTAS